MRGLSRLLALLVLLTAFPAAAAERPVTILISIDGFRADYLQRGVTPTLRALADGGAWAGEGMRPSYPANTFPNHYTLVTGLRPDHHGIVDNTIEDTGRPGVTFTMGNHDAVVDGFWWNQGEPLWVTAEKHGVKAATMFWPGSEAAVRGVRPSYMRPYDKNVLAEARVDQVLAWLDLPAAERPGFVTLYFDEVDTLGHYAGPDSQGVNDAMARTDAAIARLLAGLKARGLSANLVVAADHGMAPTTPTRVVWIDDMVDIALVRVVTNGWGASLFPKAGYEAQVEAAMTAPRDHVQCWPKAKVPVRYHYGTNPRVPPIVCLTEVGWNLGLKAKPPAARPGSHGFDPYDPLMRALFIANGPDIRPGVVLPVFDNVDVYPLLARLTGVGPQTVDGSLAVTGAALK